MKKLLVTIILTSIAFIANSCKDQSTSTIDRSSYLNLAQGNWWEYDVYSLDESNNPTENIISTDTITLGAMAKLDGKSAYPLLNSNTNIANKELFTHIGSDEDGIYMFMNEINLNDYITDPSVTHNIPIIIPGWIKVLDFNGDKWESFFFQMDNVIDQDTVKGKLQITGKRDGTQEVIYKGKTYSADLVKMTISLSANVKSATTSIDESKTSDLNYAFIEGVGIYSLQQNANELVGINNGFKEILIDHKK
ncbi:hypothetical protein EP342_03660 [bacterium]|nr:MAG: hypothetical protein EP342_03660 [bacterium]